MKNEVSQQKDKAYETRKKIILLEKQISHTRESLPKERKQLDSFSYNDLDGLQIIGKANSQERQSLARVLKEKDTSSPPRLIEHLRAAGSNEVANMWRWLLGKDSYVPYDEVVEDVAKQLKVKRVSAFSLHEKEKAIIETFTNRMLEEMTPQQRKEFIWKMEAEAQKHGQSYKAVLSNTGGIALANASGFGIYMAASTVVGAITSALGVTLPFIFYTSMSTAISVLIGPVGWAALCTWLVSKLGAPNMKKTIPGVLIVAAMKARLEFERTDRLRRIDHALTVELPQNEQELAELQNALEAQNQVVEEMEAKLRDFLDGVGEFAPA